MAGARAVTRAAKKVPRSVSECGFAGCDRAHEAKGYCQGHYRQFMAGNPLQPIRTRNLPKNEVECERCGHVFYPRISDHRNRCAHCRSRFKTDLALTREKSRTAPEGKRWCRGCERYRSSKFFPSSEARCKPCLKAHTADRRAQKVYSLLPGQYMELYRHQGGKCWLCRRATGARKSLSVDHDHSCCPGETSCGKCVRGLLCGGCNYKVLGHARDDIDFFKRCIDYLTSPPAVAVIGVRITPDMADSDLTLNGV